MFSLSDSLTSPPLSLRGPSPKSPCHRDQPKLLLRLLEASRPKFQCHTTVTPRDVDHYSCSRAFGTIVKCLFVIRDAETASISGCGDALNALVSKMQSPICCDVDVIRLGLECQRMGDEYLKKDEHNVALIYYSHGFGSMKGYRKEKITESGSLPRIHQHLTVRSVKAELECSYAHVANTMMAAQMGIKKQRYPEKYKLYLTRKARKHATAALWVGAPDRLRRKAHWELALAYMMMTELNHESLKIIRLTESDCLTKAVEQMWYAMCLYNPDPSSIHTNPLYQELCSGLRDPTKPFPLAEVEIPALGTWISDPGLLRKWGSRAVMMRFYRQRAWPSLGETMGEYELQHLYSRHSKYKVEWDHNMKGGYQFRGALIEQWDRRFARLEQKIALGEANR